MGKEIVWQGRYIRSVVRDGWEYVERIGTSGIVAILALTDDRKVVLVEQYRRPVESRVIEWPAGLVGDEAGGEGESFESAARRELLEETGYEAQFFRPMASGTLSAGLSNERMTLFLASGLRKVGPGGGEGGEEIVIHEVPVGQLVRWLGERERAGVAVDVKVYATLAFVGE